MSEFTLEELSADELEMIGAGNARDTTTGSFVRGSGASCANAMLFWGGTASGIGAMSSGVVGLFGGAAIGGYLAAKYSKLCLGI